MSKSRCGEEDCVICAIIAENSLPPERRKVVTIRNHMGSGELIRVEYDPASGVVSPRREESGFVFIDDFAEMPPLPDEVIEPTICGGK